MTAAPTTKQPTRDTRAAPAPRLPLILVIVLPVLALWPVVPSEFIPLDDGGNVSRNPDFNPPTLRGVARYWTQPFLNMYAPLTYTAWAGVAHLAWMDATDHGGLQLNPYVFHAVNLLVHVVNALLVYALLSRLLARPDAHVTAKPTGQAWAACAGALLFAMHPMQVEPVAWVTGFRDLLAAMFSLASLLAYVAHATRDGRGGGAYVFACVLLVAALLCKPTTVVVPLLAGVIDWAILRRPLRDVARPVAGLLLIVIPFAILAKRVQSADVTFTPPLWARPVVAADALAFYAGKLVVPLRMGMDYGRSPRWLLDQPGWGWLWLATVPLAAALWVLRRQRWLIAGILVLVASLLPVLGLTKFDFQHHSTVADRYVYLGMLGAALLVSFAVWKGGRNVAIGCGVILLLLGGLSHVQSRHWTDGKSIFEATLVANPHSLVANRGLALIALDQGRREDAEAMLDKTLRAHPDDAVTHFHLGNLFLATRRAKQAVPHLRVAAEMHHEPWVVTNYANALAQSGEVAEAQRVLAAALAEMPNSAELHATFAAVRFRQGDRAGAADHYRAALRIKPDFALAAQELAALERATTTSTAPSTLTTQPGQ